MNFHKLFLVILFVIMPLESVKANRYVDLVIGYMQLCYQNEDKVGVEMAKCMSNHLTKVANPDAYRATIIDTNPDKNVKGDISITLKNKHGLIIQCKGTAKEKIHIDSCQSEKIENFNINDLQRL